MGIPRCENEIREIGVEELDEYCVDTGETAWPGALSGGKRRLYRFPNGYGASVVRWKLSETGQYFSYTSDESEWELAVVEFESDDNNDFTLVYDTPITDGVIGHLHDSQVKETLLQISRLEAKLGAEVSDSKKNT